MWLIITVPRIHRFGKNDSKLEWASSQLQALHFPHPDCHFRLDCPHSTSKYPPSQSSTVEDMGSDASLAKFVWHFLVPVGFFVQNRMQVTSVEPLLKLIKLAESITLRLIINLCTTVWQESVETQPPVYRSFLLVSTFSAHRRLSIFAIILSVSRKNMCQWL